MLLPRTLHYKHLQAVRDAALYFKVSNRRRTQGPGPGPGLVAGRALDREALGRGACRQADYNTGLVVT